MKKKNKEPEVIVRKITERKHPPVEWMIRGRMPQIIPVKHVLNNPVLTSQRVVLERLTNQPFNLAAHEKTHATHVDAMIELRKMLRGEIKYLTEIIKNKKKSNE